MESLESLELVEPIDFVGSMSQRVFERACSAESVATLESTDAHQSDATVTAQHQHTLLVRLNAQTPTLAVCANSIFKFTAHPITSIQQHLRHQCECVECVEPFECVEAVECIECVDCIECVQCVECVAEGDVGEAHTLHALSALDACLLVMPEVH